MSFLRRLNEYGRRADAIRRDEETLSTDNA